MNPTSSGLIRAAMYALEDMPCGGVGDAGPTLAEIGEAEGRGDAFGGDAGYHQAQKAWRLLQEALLEAEATC